MATSRQTKAHWDHWRLQAVHLQNVIDDLHKIIAKGESKDKRHIERLKDFVTRKDNELDERDKTIERLNEKISTLEYEIENYRWILYGGPLPKRRERRETCFAISSPR